MRTSVFVDGDQGTTGLEILARLAGRHDIDLVTLPEAMRKDPAARAIAINECDVAVLCLPDEAARQAVASIRNPRVRVIDASSAHRTDAAWVYGFPEMAPEQAGLIAEARRVSNPGCYPTGAIALLRPLVEAGCLRADVPLTPRQTFGLVAAWEQHGTARVGFEFYYTGRQRLEDNPYRDESEPYTIIGLLAERRFGRVRAFVNLENLTNVRQSDYNPLLLPTPTVLGKRAVSAWAPLDGRTINAGVRIGF